MNRSIKIIIEGITLEGRVFRPSDWAERLCGRLATFHNQRILYSTLLSPGVINDHNSVIVDPRLKETNPELYDHIMEFGQLNHLKVYTVTDE